MNSWAQMDLVGEAVTLHARCSVDRISKQAVTRHLLPNHTCQDRTAVETNTDLQKHNKPALGIDDAERSLSSFCII